MYSINAAQLNKNPCLFTHDPDFRASTSNYTKLLT